MATLTNTKIKDTYVGLLKTTDNQAIDAAGVTLVEDGAGNASALSVGRSGNGVTITGGLNATLSTAAQPNITSVGTLSSLAVSGNLTVDTDTLYVDAANNRVGIGTSSPDSPLHVIGTTAANFQRTSAGTINTLYTPTGANTQWSVGAHSDGYFRITNEGIAERMRIDSSGNVGIGESSPAEKIHLGGSSNQQIRINAATVPAFLGGYNNQSVFTSNRSITTGSIINSSYGSAYISLGSDTSGGDVRLFTSSAANVQPVERMRIAASGNVGIGKTPSSEKFEVNGAIVWEGALTASQTSAGVLDRSGDDLRVRVYGATAGSGNFVVRTGGGGGSADSEAMRITAAGNVGIGTSSPAYKLDIKKTDAAGIYARFGASSDGGSRELTFSSSDNGIFLGAIHTINATSGSGAIAFATGGNERMRIDSSGNVGIGTSSPVGDLTVDGNRGIYVRDTDGGRLVFDDTDVADASVPMSVISNSAGSLIFSRANRNASTGLTTGTTESVRILSSGGITFNGDTAAANALDDYEEGTWTPVYEPTTGSFATMTMDIRVAKYTKIGNVVTLYASFRTDDVDVTGGSASVRIGGLPFTVSGDAGGIAIGLQSNFTNAPDGGIFINATSQITLRKTNVSTNLSVADLSDGANADHNELRFTATYMAS